jgi:hypothetical protein
MFILSINPPWQFELLQLIPPLKEDNIDLVLLPNLIIG